MMPVSPATSPPGRPCRRDMQMSCKVCGVVMSYDFSVTDTEWTAIVPGHLHERVICAGCFHRFALSAGVSKWEPDS